MGRVLFTGAYRGAGRREKGNVQMGQLVELRANEYVSVEEEPVLRDAIEDMGRWIERLPNGSGWAASFLRTRSILQRTVMGLWPDEEMADGA